MTAPQSTSGAREPVDQDDYRELSELLTAGLAVLTTRQGRHDVAVTVDSFLDVSYDPPTMLVALYGMSRAAEAAEEAGHFCLNLLTEDQQHLADRFGTPAAPLIGMLSGIEVTRTADGDAVLPGVLAHFGALHRAGGRRRHPSPAHRARRGAGRGARRCRPRRAFRGGEAPAAVSTGTYAGPMGCLCSDPVVHP